MRVAIFCVGVHAKLFWSVIYCTNLRPIPGPSPVPDLAGDWGYDICGSCGSMNPHS